MGPISKNTPEKVLWADELGGVQQASQDFIKDHHSSLLRPRVASCFHTHSSSRGKSDDDLSPLLHVNAELKVEQSTLLLKNSELLSRTLLLKLENRRLKEQLELQLRKTHIDASSSSASLSAGSSLLSEEEDLSDTDNNEFEHTLETGFNEVKLAPASSRIHSP